MSNELFEPGSILKSVDVIGEVSYMNLFVMASSCLHGALALRDDKFSAVVLRYDDDPDGVGVEEAWSKANLSGRPLWRKSSLEEVTNAE